VADITEYLRKNAVQGPRRKKRDGNPQSLWAAPTLASNQENDNRLSETNQDLISGLSDNRGTEDSALVSQLEFEKEPAGPLLKSELESEPDLEKTIEISARIPTLNEVPSLLLETPFRSTEILGDPIVRVPKKRHSPVTVGKPSKLPLPPVEFDFEKDERFLSKYWMSPGPGGVPRNQERFFNFYRHLYNEAARTRCARIYFTEPMAIEILGPKARGTFTNYRKLGTQYGLFYIHMVSNLDKSGNKPGTYFYLCDPWKNQ
jgi:hypothetical protein